MPDIFINPPAEEKPKKKKDLLLNPKKFNINPDNVEDLPGHTHNPFSSYCYFPHNVGFINKEPNEKIVLLIRRHFFTNLGWIVLVIAMIFAPMILNYFPLLAFLPVKFQTASLLFWYLLTSAIAIQGFLSWFFSVNLITNLRVIDVDFENLIYRRVTDAKLEHIEDVTVQMGSVIRTLFNYGDVLIQTAAEIQEVEFWAVPHPDKVDKLLSDLRLDAKL
ncbi:hypothetical protein BH10PAT1_BH10PAT1_7380 [soil metagenome]